MLKRIFIAFILLTLILSTLSFGEDINTEVTNDEFSEFIIEEDESENLPISIDELGMPRYIMAEVVDNDILLNWTNHTNISISGENHQLEYEIDFKVGRNLWISEINEKLLHREALVFDSIGKSFAKFNPLEEGLDNEDIDLDNRNYSIRLRYVYKYMDEGQVKDICGRFSSPINLGLQPHYQLASPWALKELDKASEYGFITEKIRYDMRINITREEFCELIMRLYYELGNKAVNYSKDTFADADNPEVLKALELGIVTGVGNNKFAPNNFVTREEIAVMINRLLKLVGTTQINVNQNIDYIDKTETSSWAIEGIGFALNSGIIKGDSEGKINPKGHSSREQATIMILRTYENFKKVGGQLVSK